MTTIHVGKSRTATLAFFKAGKQIPQPAGVSFGWDDSLDGGNVVLNNQGSRCTIQCTGRKAQGDYEPGRPMNIRALVTDVTGKVTEVTDTIDLVSPDAPPASQSLADQGITVQMAWGPEQ